MLNEPRSTRPVRYVVCLHRILADKCEMRGTPWAYGLRPPTRLVAGRLAVFFFFAKYSFICSKSMFSMSLLILSRCFLMNATASKPLLAVVFVAIAKSLLVSVFPESDVLVSNLRIIPSNPVNVHNVFKVPTHQYIDFVDCRQGDMDTVGTTYFSNNLISDVCVGQVNSFRSNFYEFFLLGG